MIYLVLGARKVRKRVERLRVGDRVESDHRRWKCRLKEVGKEEGRREKRGKDRGGYGMKEDEGV